jgi:tetratricopeptide (TPR) repeat protein
MGEPLVIPESPDDQTLEDERLLWMASADEQLAQGATLEALPEITESQVVRACWQRDAAWCEWVRSVWPNPETFGHELSAPTHLDGQQTGSESSRACPSRFQILRALGRGAFGEVYLAYDTHLRRDVALKMPRGEILLTPELRSRFRQEARAAAGLDHPHIVPVFDAGEEGSTCFIASAYCPGITLAEWLRRRSVPVPHRLAADLLVKLAEAVEHAHTHGVLHRDLKPSNVLLEVSTKEGTDDDASALNPRITDFGLAKLVDIEPGTETRAAATMSGVILGTPSYMAPEQADGRGSSAGPAADVYGLGAIFYEVLTGRPPFQEDSTLETLMLVRSQDPVPPSRLRPRLPRDLETISLKCLHKQPHGRYASAKTLADDLRRFLAAQPIIARPTPVWERAVKWARRNPARATLAVALVVSAVAFTGVIGAANVGLKRERDRAEARRKEAVANLGKARDAVDRLLTRVSEERLRDIPQVEPIQRALLEDALEFYKDLVRQSHDDPEILHEAGRAYRRVGQTYSFMGRLADAERNLRESLAIQSRLANAFPTVAAYRHGLGGTLVDLGKLHRNQARTDEARVELDKAVTLFGDLAHAYPNEPRFRSELAAAYNTRGMLTEDLHQEEGAAKDYHRGIALLDELARQLPNTLKYQTNAGVARNNVAAMMQSSGRLAEAEAIYLQNLQLWESFAAREPSVLEHRSKIAMTLDNLADILMETDRPREREQTLQRCIEIRSTIVRDFPNTTYHISRLADSLTKMAEFVSKRGDLVEAQRLYVDVVRHRRTIVAMVPENRDGLLALTRTYLALIETLLKIRNHAVAAKFVEELVAVSGLPSEDLQRSGAYLARCARLASSDRDLPDSRRAELAASYADRAMTLLHDAQKHGLGDLKALQQDPSFDALRSRDDFRALLPAPTNSPAPRQP